MTHSFPMVRAGGLFILIMGAGVALGSFFSAQRRLFLALGGGSATIAIVLSAGALSDPFGEPSHLQLWALGGSILLEVVLIRYVVAVYKSAGERVFLLAILMVVGIHFIPMALAFGPLCGALSICAIANASLGLWVLRAAPLKYLWLADGILKIAFGAFMFLAFGACGS
jgi:hypothetical protein